MIMKKVIWKIELSEQGIQNIRLPKNYQILTLQKQRDIPCIWVLVDPTEPIMVERFEIYGTGHEIHFDTGTNREYIGTFQDGSFVWHLFKYTDI